MHVKFPITSVCSAQHKSLHRGYIAGGERDFEALIQMMSITWTKPKQENNCLVYLAIKLEVTVYIKDDILSANDTQQQAYNSVRKIGFR